LADDGFLDAQRGAKFVLAYAFPILNESVNSDSEGYRCERDARNTGELLAVL
jgi:hypothetical protein